ncbi:MAG: UDP-N-acetylmuramoyl-tripeptide--D-alanyl-D-alanine ligase [Acidobacteria bacterium]|nr:UDP-N-acetylmuramoyl-tripeptide--D-alanyl-D-alanine ligase [Acidobacteriota bacterium]
MELALGEIAQIVGAPPTSSDRQVRGYSIDSRTVRADELFFAVRGTRLDGHDFVTAALEAGAAAAVVARERFADFPVAAQSNLLAVPDTLKALHQLAAAVRRRWGGPVVAVTGSTGKTTTKQMIAALLATRFGVQQNEGNLNNHFGLPLSLLRLQPETEVGVFELAMSAPGEIRRLAELARPDVGVVTNVSAAHLEFFPDVEAIARAKFELIEAMSERAWAVLNADDPRVSAFGEHRAGRVIYFGIREPAHFRAEEVGQNGQGEPWFTLARRGYQGLPLGWAWDGRIPLEGTGESKPPETRFHLPLLGRHNVLNALAALGVCYLFGIPPDYLQEAVAGLQPVAMRGEPVRLANGALVIQDCYNSSPEALEAMLMTVAALPARRRLAVLGGMLELGPTSESLHMRCGARVAQLKFDVLITVGELACAFAAGAQAEGMAAEALIHCATPEEAGGRLREMLRPDEVVLLKASRAIHLERVWEGLGDLEPASEVARARTRHG